MKKRLDSSKNSQVSKKILLESSCKGLSLDQELIVESIFNEVTAIVEAELSSDQISQVFKNIETNVTQAGGNRTLAGKAVDAAAVANKIIDRIGGYLQDTTPVKYFDQKFEDLKTKVSTKFPNLENYLTKLGSWAKANPGKTAAVVGVLTALAAISAGPAGGAIAGQVLRGSVELMKGEKLSTAVGKGLKTAALGYLSGKAIEMVSNYLQGLRVSVIPVPGAKESGLKEISFQASENRLTSGPGFSSDIKRDLKAFNIQVFPKEAQTITNLVDGFVKGEWNGFQKIQDFARYINSPEYKAEIAKAIGAARTAQLDNDGLLNWIKAIGNTAQAITQGTIAASGAAASNRPATKGTTSESKSTINPSCLLTESHVKLIFKLVAKQHLINEGLWDTIKGAAGKAAGKAAAWAQTKGQNITTKITADKLQKSWEKAGKPKDSAALAAWLIKQGVNSDTVKSTFSSLGIDHSISSKSIEDKIGQLTPDQAKYVLDQLKAAPVGSARSSAAADFAAAIAKNDINAARRIIGDASQLDNTTKTKIRSSIEKSKLPFYYKKLLLKNLGKNVGYWMKESIFIEICKILTEHNLTWKNLGFTNVYRNADTNRVAIFEYASGGSTSAGSVASIANPGGAMMPTIRRMPAGQSFFAPQHAGTKKKKKLKKMNEFQTHSAPSNKMMTVESKEKDRNSSHVSQIVKKVLNADSTNDTEIANLKKQVDKKFYSDTKATSKNSKNTVNSAVKALVSKGRTSDEAIADLKKQVDKKFYAKESQKIGKIAGKKAI